MASKEYQEIVKRYIPIVLSHFAKNGYELRIDKVQEAVRTLIDFRVMCDTAEGCLEHLYPPLGGEYLKSIMPIKGGNNDEEREEEAEEAPTGKIWSERGRYKAPKATGEGNDKI